MAQWVKTLLAKPEKLREWTDEFGSPLHITELSEFNKNIDDLTNPIKERGLDSCLYFARKANKLAWFVKAAKAKGIGVDTASLLEVEETLELGLDPEKVVVTAIGKDKNLVEQSIKSGCLLIIDNEDELDLIEATARELNKKARVGLRFSGFQTDYRVVFSRFGFPIKDAIVLASKVNESSHLKLEVFHAHIDKYKTEERASAAFAMIKVIDELKSSKGININGIDLGGGILINYLNSQEQWSTYRQQLEEAVLEKRPHFNANNDGLGLTCVNGKLEGEPEVYPFWNDNAKGTFIANILDQKEDGIPLSKQLASRNLKLYFEPGRALLDNAGITLGCVSFRKYDTEGNYLVGLSMNRMNLRPFRQEFCVDPVHVSFSNNLTEMKEPAYLAGCLCSESDLIYRRKIQLTHKPEVNDLFLFPNSAGYLAHHMEIGTHGNPLPKNILIDSENLEILDTF